MNIFSFFSGAGFLDLGFELQGNFNVVFVNEFHKAFNDELDFSHCVSHRVFHDVSSKEKRCLELFRGRNMVQKYCKQLAIPKSDYEVLKSKSP